MVSSFEMKIEDKTVLITGCTGFLGGHLAKRLAHFKRTRIRGLIRHPLSSTSKIAGLPIEKVFGDMTSFEAMLNATRGCDVVVHCAVSFHKRIANERILSLPIWIY